MNCTATAELPESKLEAHARTASHRSGSQLESRRKSDSLVSDGPNPALLQPVRHCLQTLQLGDNAPEAPYLLAVPARGYRYIVGFVADVNACSMGIDHFQAEVFALDLPHRLAWLLAVTPFPWLRVEGLLVAFWIFCGGLVFMLTSPR
ncbi:MAG TPA: hypothetical protein VMU26_28095 [Candidatus Polarisedimenticolia bacterium]|nr:hypothetical protein [Candidatus Polarisedimenticolia bacterium]